MRLVSVQLYLCTTSWEMVRQTDIDLAARQEYTLYTGDLAKASIPLYWNLTVGQTEARS